MDTKIKKMRVKLAKQREKIAELELQSIEIEQEIERVEGKQLSHLARSAASNLSGGMDEVFERLRGFSQTKEENSETGEEYDREKEDEIADEIEV